MRILLVEDSLTSVAQFKHVISGLDPSISVIATRKFEDAKQHLDDADVVVFDLGLPDLDVNQVIEVVRSHPGPRMVFSGNPSVELAHDLGTQRIAFIPKDVELNVLAQLVANQLGMVESSSELQARLQSV